MHSAEDRAEYEDVGFWTEKFIQAVRSRPAIYNTSKKENVERSFVANCWLEVCKEMIPKWNQMSSNRKALKLKEAQSKWKNLRTCFRRELHKQKSMPKAISERQKRRRYLYFDHLLFLLPTIKDRDVFNDPKKSPPKREQKKSESDEEVYETTYFDESDSMSQSHSQSQFYSNEIEDPVKTLSPDPVPVLTRQTSVDVEHISLTQPKESYTFQRQPTSRGEFIDEDKTFLLSLVPTFKRLNNLEKLDVKIEFLQTLKRMTQSKEIHRDNQLRSNTETEGEEEKYHISSEQE